MVAACRAWSSAAKLDFAGRDASSAGPPSWVSPETHDFNSPASWFSSPASKSPLKSRTRTGTTTRTIGVNAFPTEHSSRRRLQFRAGKPPHHRRHHRAEDHSHDGRPQPKSPLFAVIISSALARQQVKARTRFVFFAEEHGGKIANPAAGHKPRHLRLERLFDLPAAIET